MKENILLLATTFALLSPSLTARIISPDGSAYTSISANYELRSGYEAENLFDQYLLAGQDAGDGNDAGRAWAGNETSPSAVIEFELDAVHDVDAIVYAQRQYLSYVENDKFAAVDIWASETTAFSSTTAPSQAAQVTNLSLRTDLTDKFQLYRLPTTIRGKYFRLEFKRALNATGIAGGTELRLVENLTSASSEIISPDGSLYTSVQANSELNGNYVASNLFDQNLNPGDDPGSNSDAGRAWAIGSGSTATLSFQLDRVYQVESLLYSQRQYNASNSSDKARRVEIWTDTSSPLTTQPNRLPDATLSLDPFSSDLFLEYALPTSLNGRYFFLKFYSYGGGLMGGTELRFFGSSGEGDAQPRIMGLRRDSANNHLDLSLKVPAPASYKLQYATDLSANNWTDLPNGSFVAEFADIDFRDTHAATVAPADGKAFYRVIEN
ncbi:MAG: discoidin domain-containing protein [Verrucomicrobiota bacterium JB023]|nr:discoidin domain-containing protein [Verrucomicrobiota bacterium JB023]